MSDQSQAKRVGESAIEMIETVLPSDANPFGNIIGGKVMHLVDIAGSMAALRHCRRPVVTAAVERLDFRYPIKVGHFIILRAVLHYVGRTSMEVCVQVLSENPVTGEQRHASTAHLTFVALDDQGRPTEVPRLLLETEEEKRHYEAALIRREQRAGELEPSPRAEILPSVAQVHWRGLIVDSHARRVELNGGEVDLTPTEFSILRSLIQHAGKVLACREIVNEVYGYELDEASARLLLRPHLSRLRQKLTSEPDTPPFIVNVWGIGYMFERRRALRED